MHIALRITVAAAIVAVLVVASRTLDRKWREKHPTELPFAWGYFQALCFFPAGLLWFFTPLFYSAASLQLWLAILVYGIVGSYAGYMLITAKRKWAWVFVVVAQLNIVTLLIDIYYGSNRWREFR